jgi:hypothetical protein
VSRKPPSEPLSQLLADALELTRQGIAVSSRLDEERQKDIDKLWTNQSSILALLNGEQGIIIRVSKLCDWMEDHKKKCSSLNDANITGKWNIRNALIVLLGVIISAIISSLTTVWLAHLK